MPIDLDPLAGPEGGEKGRRLAAFWIDQINSIRDSLEIKQWQKRGDRVERRYRDERSRTDEVDGDARRYNALWSNVEILKPALYGRTPLPVAERKFKDKDPTGRFAAEILERALRNEIEICGYHDATQRAVSDYLLPGRGTVWVRYEPEISESVSLPSEPQTDMSDTEGQIGTFDTIPKVMTAGGRMRVRLPDEEMDQQAGEADQTGGEEVPADQMGAEPEIEQEKLNDTGDRIIRESTPVDFVSWSDFITFPARARTWSEVTAIGKRVYMSRDQLKKRFGETIGKKIPLEKDDRGQRTQNGSISAPDQDKAQIYEIWSKEDRTLYWVSMGYTYLCDRKDDPLRLENFYPVPPPLYANPTNSTLTPVPDYIQYQDQAMQIDELTQRIAMLTKCCKMAGVYNAAAKDIQRLFNESVENQLIPVDDWAAFGKDGGGVEGNWSLMPVKDIIGIINELMICKQKQIEEMDRLTGINDIMRGTSDARETLGGVRLKNNNTGTRLTYRQDEVARFCRDTVRIMADIMSQHFSEQSLVEASGALYEEGLGPDDMPPLNQLQTPLPPQPKPGMGMAPGQPTQFPGPMGQPPVGVPPGASPQPPGPPQMGQPPQMGAPQGNVIPFKPPQPPGAPMGVPGVPPGGPAPVTGAVLPPVDPHVAALQAAIQRITAAIQLLRNERLRGFRVDIEVDSTIYPNMAQEQDERTKFIAAITQFLQQAMALGAGMPEIVPLLSKLLLFGVRGFKVSRDLESAIEEFADTAPAMLQKRLTEQSNKPDPNTIKAQSEQAKTASMLQIANMNAASDSKKADAEIERQRIENEGEQTNAAIDLQSNQVDYDMKMIDKRIEEVRLQIELARLTTAREKPEKATAEA